MQYARNSEIRTLPKKWEYENDHVKDAKTIINSGMKTGNFDIQPLEVLIVEGFLPITTINNEEYDPEIEIRTGPTITENADHAVLEYVVADKPLLEVQEAKKEKVKEEGRQIFKAKWDLEYKIMGMYDEAQLTQLDGDYTTLLNYYKTEIKSLIEAAENPLAVKNVLYTWPSITSP
jgi:hypothetical protein